MIDCVGDRGRCPDIAEFADTLDADWIDECVFLRNQDDINIPYICVHRNKIIGEIVVDVARRSLVDLGRFMKR